MTRKPLTMIDGIEELVRSPWRWDWVPSAAAGAERRAAWTAELTQLLEGWTRDGLGVLRETWPDDAGLAFPLTPDVVGRGVADWLLERADRLPDWARLAWGAVFVGGRPRWAPVPVVVEFCTPEADDPDYLMDMVWARGSEADAREPVVEYVTTPIGDGLRVFALCRSEEGTAYARVHAALRVDLPPGDGVPGVSADVLLTTFVLDMGLMALIGPGVERLMLQIADECAPAGGGPARLGMVPAVAGAGAGAEGGSQ